MILVYQAFSRTTWVNWYQNVSFLNFIGAKDDGGGADNYWSYKTCKASVKSSRTPLISVGDRAFPVIRSCPWNRLPHVVISAPTLAVFWNESTQNLPVLSFVHALTDAYTLFIGLALFT